MTAVVLLDELFCITRKQMLLLSTVCLFPSHLFSYLAITILPFNNITPLPTLVPVFSKIPPPPPFKASAQTRLHHRNHHTSPTNFSSTT